MKKLLVVIIMTGILFACKMEQDEYDADQKAYKECVKNEPSMDDCVFDYVKYLPEQYQKEMENNND